MSKTESIFIPVYIVHDKSKSSLLCKKLRMMIKSKENINWERTQELHNLAYEIVDRKIKNEFKDDCYTIQNINIHSDEKPLVPYNSNEAILGMTLLLNRVLKWRPKKDFSEWTNLEKEIVHVMTVKEKVICNLLLLYMKEQ